MTNTGQTTVLETALPTAGDHSFIALQFVISSYPEDPLRVRLRALVNELRTSTIATDVATSARSMLRMVLDNLSLAEYMVWDYSLVSSVANSEFREWVSGIQEVREESAAERDDVEFQSDCTSYFVLTFALRSKHASLRSWLHFYPEHLEKNEFFQRKTIATILERFTQADSTIVGTSTEVLCELMPTQDDRFYSAVQLQDDKEWKYLRPMY